MIRSELDAAGIDDPRLRDAYRRCREINAAHGRTFFLATRCWRRTNVRPVHALYGFARHADDILDELDPQPGHRSSGPNDCSGCLTGFFAGGEHRDDPGACGGQPHRRRYDIAPELFTDFLASMRMDLTSPTIPTATRSTSTCAARRKRSACKCFRYWAPSAPRRRPRRTPQHSVGRFSSPNFCVTSTKTCCDNASTCPPTNWPPTEVDRDLLMWCHLTAAPIRRVRRALAAQHEITRETLPVRRRWDRLAGAALSPMRGNRSDAVFGDPGLHRR